MVDVLSFYAPRCLSTCNREAFFLSEMLLFAPILYLPLKDYCCNNFYINRL